MVPKLKFKWSWIYNQRWQPMRERNAKEPSVKELEKQIVNLQKLWSKNGDKILKEISKVTRLGWHEKETICYVTWGISPFSDPLTLSYRKDVRVMLDVLVHEMIHRIWSEPENWPKLRKNWEKTMKKYKRFSHTTRIHIPLHAIHKHIFLKYFGAKRLQSEIDWSKDFKDYKLAWNQVEKEGHQKIISEFTQGM